MELQERPGTDKNPKKDAKSQDRKTENQEDISTITTAPPPRKMRFGSYRQTMKCPHCRGQMTTRIATRATVRTHLMATLLCLTCMWPCIPWVYCTDSCLKHEHYCNRCDEYLGSSDFLSTLRLAPK